MLEDRIINASAKFLFGVVYIDVWSMEVNAPAYQGLYNLLIYVGEENIKEMALNVMVELLAFLLCI
jgi:hypothetical protein